MARLAVLTALGTILIVMAAVIPSARLGMLAIASFPVCAALMMYGAGRGAGVFAVTAVLGFLLFPGAVSAGYAAFFGWYPIAKSFCERLSGRVPCLAAKLGVYTAAFALCFLLASALIPSSETLAWYWLYLMGLPVFYVFDWAYSLLIRLYLDKLARFFT